MKTNVKVRTTANQAQEHGTEHHALSAPSSISESTLEDQLKTFIIASDQIKVKLIRKRPADLLEIDSQMVAKTGVKMKTVAVMTILNSKKSLQWRV